MKRTELKRKTALKRSGRPKPARRVHKDEPGRTEFKRWRRGRCDACGHPGWVYRHHVVREQHVRQYHGDPWDTRNSMWVSASCLCHEMHHKATRRIPLSRVPAPARVFATELLGAYVTDYLEREYAAA